MEITITGSGTSQGVPVIGCDCEVCKSSNPKDNRLRSSIHIYYKNQSIVIDTGPDFRQQMINNNVSTLDAILFTHEHKDHVAGLDDVRPFNFIQKKPIEIYCNKQVFTALKREFHYIFDPKFQYPGIPKINRNEISKERFLINKKIEIEPIEVLHHKLPVFGYRIDDFAYITDAKTIDENEKNKLKNLDLLILNALRLKKHLSHFNLEEAIELIQELQPKKAILTHISHFMGLHSEIEKTLPENISLGYDNQKIILN